MSAAFSASRNHLILGLCLPLAVLLGFLMAEPFHFGSVVLLGGLASILTWPFLIRYYHPLLVFSLNSALHLAVLPGDPPLWLPLTGLGFLVMLLNRSLGSQSNLRRRDPVGLSLLLLLGVIVLTMAMTGGLGIRSLGGSTYGGKRYVLLIATILAYFVIASRRVNPKRARLYVALFFLPAILALLANVAYMLGPSFNFVYWVISPSSAYAQYVNEARVYESISRVSGFADASEAILLFLLAFWGVRGFLDPRRPYRLLLAAAVLGVGMLSGFRSFFGFVALVFMVGFFLEGLHKSRYAFLLIGLMLLCGAGVVAFAKFLPLPVQRCISFLPVEVDPFVKADAEGSILWRTGMWRQVLPEVSDSLLLGKGYRIDPRTMELSQLQGGSEWAVVSGDYHNGPLSILIPFGLWGLGAFAWFVFAAGRVLYRNVKRGEAQLRLVNSALLACFCARAFFSFFLVGDVSNDLLYLVVLVGLGVSLNGSTQGASCTPYRTKLLAAGSSQGSTVRSASEHVAEAKPEETFRDPGLNANPSAQRQASSFAHGHEQRRA